MLILLGFCLRTLVIYIQFIRFMNRKYEKLTVAVSVVLVNSLLLGLFGVLARIKQPMAEEFGLDEQFLGTLDSLTFIGGIFGFIYVVIFPCKKPVRDLTVQCFGVTVFLGFYYLAQILGQPKLLLSLGTLFSGFGRSYTVVAFTIVAHHFHETKTDKIILQVCFGLAMLGDIFSVLISDYMIADKGINWAMAMNIYLGGFLLSALAMFLLVKQIPLEENSNKNKSALKQAKKFIIVYCKSQSNILHGIMFVITSSGYYMMLMWLPYYFMKIGFETQACLISTVYPIAYMIGIFLLQPIEKFFSNSIGKVIIFSLVLSSVSGLMLTFLGNSVSQIPFYITLLAISTIFTSGCSARVTTVEIEERIKGDKQFMIVSSFLRLIQQLLFGVNLQISGLLMELSIHSFFYIQLFYAAISTAICISRVWKYPQQFIMKENKSSLQNYKDEQAENPQKAYTASTYSSEHSIEDGLIINS